jgi:hypothetical protein
LFELDDLLVNASAEPVPPEEVDDSSHQLLYRAALVLYSCDGDFEVLMALEELQTAMYHVEQINSPFCATLLECRWNGPSGYTTSKKWMLKRLRTRKMKP